jgi:cell filamentation protein
MDNISIRFFDDKEVRAVWAEEKNKWWHSVVDIVSVITDSPRPRVYWGALKSRQSRNVYERGGLFVLL